jgi:hypothetical protein
MRITTTAFWLVVLAAASTDGQEIGGGKPYWLKQGEGYPVCRDFLENVNDFPVSEPPMVCEQKIHPAHPEFAHPIWEEMDIEGNLRLIFDAESLLWRFTPIGSSPPDFAVWAEQFRADVRSGERKPRLRRMPFMVRENEPETLVSYEPFADECAVGLAESGVGGNPGGYLFVLRKATDRLEAFGGLIGTQTRTDVWQYHGFPYVTTADPGHEIVGEPRLVDGVLANELRPIYVIGLHSISPRLAPTTGQYLATERCYVGTDQQR